MTAHDWEQIGTVEILQLRIYPIDPTASDRMFRTEVAVEPGIYPLYRKADAYCWKMRGNINERNEKIGDGLYVLNGGDKPTGPEVEFSSRVFGPEEFADLLAESTCQPGPQQRLRFEVSA